MNLEVDVDLSIWYVIKIWHIFQNSETEFSQNFFCPSAELLEFALSDLVWVFSAPGRALLPQLLWVLAFDVDVNVVFWNVDHISCCRFLSVKKSKLEVKITYHLKPNLWLAYQHSGSLQAASLLLESTLWVLASNYVFTADYDVVTNCLSKFDEQRFRIDGVIWKMIMLHT